MRRRLLVGGSLALASAAGALWMGRNELLRKVLLGRETDVALSSAAEVAVCQLTPEQTEGPFRSPAPFRQDIREDRPGIPFDLRFKVESNCEPLMDALVEIWHCDAAGRYSAYPQDISRSPFDTMMLVDPADPNGHVEPTSEGTFLRGTQQTGSDGVASFKTIFPGWYDPRVTHIHVAVTLEDVQRFASQIYFPTELSDEVYSTHPDYAPHGLCPYDHKNDPVLAEFPSAEGLLLVPDRSADAMSAQITLNIQA